METSNSHSPSSSTASTSHINSRFGEERAKMVGIGKRPLHYTGGEGWASRIAERTVYGAAVGTGIGAVTGTYKGSSVLKWARIMGTNSALATLWFCGSQELVREIRASDPDDLANCVLGGLLSGGLLGQMQGGSSRALPCALLFAGVGTFLQFGANELREYRLRRYLEQTNPELGRKPAVQAMEPKLETESWKFPEWFPVQMLDNEAAARRKAENEREFRDRVERLHKGERT